MAIVAEYSNSTNVTQRNLRMLAAGRKSPNGRGFIVEYDASQRARFDEGFQAYCRGASLDDLSDPVEIEGYWEANKSQAYAEMPTDAELDAMYADAVAVDTAQSNLGSGWK